ncbi:acyl carrier protein [Rubinisphaera margarita]|uniref:acyl carrier protein n=1 Tax=Rubinisphaera margarita TaxID=2909586 RepID=UPI001EE93B38|nr:acyl carrier protein [Rubinisphaera margarita]MCG6156502.1 acyl carrier protein [Rubinisphaera margarita]
MSIESIQQQIRDYIVSTAIDDGQADSLENDDDLLQILDSLQILRMVIEFESMFGVTIDNSDLSPETIGTINRIATFIHEKKTGR